MAFSLFAIYTLYVPVGGGIHIFSYVPKREGCNQGTRCGPSFFSQSAIKSLTEMVDRAIEEKVTELELISV